VQIKKFGNCTDRYWWEMQLILIMPTLSFDYFAASCIMFVQMPLCNSGVLSAPQ